MLKLSELIIFLLALTSFGIGVYALFLKRENRRITNNTELEDSRTSEK